MASAQGCVPNPFDLSTGDIWRFCHSIPGKIVIQASQEIPSDRFWLGKVPDSLKTYLNPFKFPGI
jgi:hypothetical protein